MNYELVHKRLQIEGVRADMKTLHERLQGLGMTPKHLRETRKEQWQSELKAKAAEHDTLVEEFNALLSSAQKT